MNNTTGIASFIDRQVYLSFQGEAFKTSFGNQGMNVNWNETFVVLAADPAGIHVQATGGKKVALYIPASVRLILIDAQLERQARVA